MQENDDAHHSCISSKSSSQTRPHEKTVRIVDIDSSDQNIEMSNQSLEEFILESSQVMEEFFVELHVRHHEFINTLVSLLDERRASGCSDERIPFETMPNGSYSPQDPTGNSIKSRTMRLSPKAQQPVCFESEQNEGTIKEVKERSDSADPPLSQRLVDIKKRSGRSAVSGKLSHAVSTPSMPEMESQWTTVTTTTLPPQSLELIMSPEPSRSHNVDTAYGRFTQLNYAKDMIHRYSDDNVQDLLNALQKCELPQYRNKGICFQPEPERTGFWAGVLKSNLFERCVLLVILLNAAFITYTTDYAVDHPEDPTNFFISTAEVFFQCFYIVELILKLSVHRLFFFVNKDYIWNILDAFLVVGAITDLTMMSVGTDNSTANKNLSFISILRLPRLTKVIRIFRVMRFFRKLNLLLKVVVSTLKLLFWCSIMLLVFFFMFAVVFTHGTATYLLSTTDEVAEPKKTQMLLDKFGSVSRSMISLYKASTGGIDWEDAAEPLTDCGHFYYGLFLFFIAFVLLALLNILTGLFVDRAMRGVAEDKDGMAISKLKADRKVVADLCRIFCAMTGEDIEKDCKITAEHFKEFVSHPVMRARLAVLDLEIWNAQHFFDMLTGMSPSRSEEVDLVTFVTGCMQLRGPVKRINLHSVHEDLRKLKKGIRAGHAHQQRLGQLLIGAEQKSEQSPTPRTTSGTVNTGQGENGV